MTAIYRNRKTGKLVIAAFNPAHDRQVQPTDQYGYHSLRDGKRFGPVMVKDASRFMELYEMVEEVSK